ncbi:MAG: sigma-70 family RNA polymerase sigma factor [Phycisphaeraceae bacterium]|nr:sigma-70 family RNA polymerase sigma factor [Phycisphaeraceae bacterium]
MEMPSYDGIIEKWKINLIISRAKRCGFKPHEMPDALQEAVLVILEFKYDPKHANGAIERTALVPIIDNRLRKMKRAETRYRMHVERFGQNATEFSRDEVDPRTIDVASAVAKLSPREQQVCSGLADDLPIVQIAKQVGCGWHTVDRIIRRLNSRLKGLDPKEREE